MNHVDAYREDKKLTFDQLGAELGISRSHACDLAHGRRKISAKMARRLSAITGKPWWEIMEGGDICAADAAAPADASPNGCTA
jgi:transcriptional regulator with XRE-family HTH domain